MLVLHILDFCVVNTICKRIAIALYVIVDETEVHEACNLRENTSYMALEIKAFILAPK